MRDLVLCLQLPENRALTGQSCWPSTACEWMVPLSWVTVLRSESQVVQFRSNSRASWWLSLDKGHPFWMNGSTRSLSQNQNQKQNETKEKERRKKLVYYFLYVAGSPNSSMASVSCLIICCEREGEKQKNGHQNKNKK